MRHSRASAYTADWEYEQLRKQQKKEIKELRKRRKSSRSQWEPVE